MSSSPVSWKAWSFAGVRSPTRASAASRSASVSGGCSGSRPSSPSRRTIGGWATLRWMSLAPSSTARARTAFRSTNVLIGRRTPPLERSESFPMPRVRSSPALFTLAVLLVFVVLGLADRHVDLTGQLGLGFATWLVLLAALRPLSVERRVQTLLVVGVATCMEVVGSILWGVYSYRLHNLPLFVPPGHGTVYLTGFALSTTQFARRHSRALVVVAAAVAAGWGIAGLGLLPRLDVAGAFGVPLLLFFLWRSPARTTYAGVFLVVAALELYGTSIGTWEWARALPGLGIPDGNPPSGVASGYVCFDVVALLTAPLALALVRRRAARRPRAVE